MSDVRESVNEAAHALMDIFRYLGDVSYAVMPRDVAHSLGDLKKSLLNCARTVMDKEIEWIEERVAGGDRLREEWQRTCQNESEPAGEPVNYGS